MLPTLLQRGQRCSRGSGGVGAAEKDSPPPFNEDESNAPDSNVSAELAMGALDEALRADAVMPCLRPNLDTWYEPCVSGKEHQPLLRKQKVLRGSRGKQCGTVEAVPRK